MLEPPATRVWPATLLAYCNLAMDRQQRAYDIVSEHHVLTVAHVNRRNSALSDALRSVPESAVGGWAWVYNTVATIRLGAKPDTDAHVLKAKLSLNWTICPAPILAGAYRFNAASPVPPPTTVATCRSICQRS